jgi:hypothetical protein
MNLEEYCAKNGYYKIIDEANAMNIEELNTWRIKRDPNRRIRRQM